MSCIFCQIVEEKIPSTKVFEDEKILAFKDIHPMAPVHVLIIPKEHFSSLVDAKNEHEQLLGKLLLKARDIAQSLGVDESGYKIIINNGAGSGQIVFHLHLHLIGGWEKKVEGFKV